MKFNSVKVFSATMWQDRDRLGDKVTDWIAANPGIHVVDMVVTQSSDQAFHCIAITVFYNAIATGKAKLIPGTNITVTRSGYDPALGRSVQDPTLPPRRLKFRNEPYLPSVFDSPTKPRAAVVQVSYELVPRTVNK